MGMGKVVGVKSRRKMGISLLIKRVRVGEGATKNGYQSFDCGG